MAIGMVKLLGLSHHAVLAEGAAVARQALAFWPAEMAAFREQLDDAVGLFEELSGQRPLREEFPAEGPLSLTDDAFLTIKYSVGPSRRAVLVIDALRAVARAFHTLPRGPRVTVRGPTASDLKDHSARQIHEASRLLDQIEAAFGSLPAAEEQSSPSLGAAAGAGGLSQQVLALLLGGARIDDPAVRKLLARPDPGISREDLKRKVLATDKASQMECPFCGLEFSARKLLSHCDKLHSFQYLPDKPVPNPRPEPRRTEALVPDTDALKARLQDLEGKLFGAPPQTKDQPTEREERTHGTEPLAANPRAVNKQTASQGQDHPVADRQQVGLVHCKRCGHVGRVKKLAWAPFVGERLVCRSCECGEWERVEGG